MAFESIVAGGGVLSQDFGQTAYAMSCRCEWTCAGYAPGAFHAGIDIASPHGETPLMLAVGYGQCVAVGRVLPGYQCSGLGPYAPCIRSGGLDFWYGHAKASLVSPGDYVVPGQPIAIMDSVGCSTGNHLHYEVVPAGASPNGCGALSPWPYLYSWPGGAPAPAPAPDPGPGVIVPGRRSGYAPALLLAGGAVLFLAGRGSKFGA